MMSVMPGGFLLRVSILERAKLSVKGTRNTHPPANPLAVTSQFVGDLNQFNIRKDRSKLRRSEMFIATSVRKYLSSVGANF